MKLDFQILVTSLSRRKFGDDGTLKDDLKEMRVAAIAVGESTGTQVVNLNTASQKYIQAIGTVNADKYNLDTDDRTHVNDAGSVVFGRIVADLLLEHEVTLPYANQVSWQPSGPFVDYISTNAALSSLIWAGKYADGA